MTGIDPRHRRDHLSLLPSGPDEVRGRLLRGDRSELSARLAQPEHQYIRVLSEEFKWNLFGVYPLDGRGGRLILYLNKYKF